MFSEKLVKAATGRHLSGGDISAFARNPVELTILNQTVDRLTDRNPTDLMQPFQFHL